MKQVLVLDLGSPTCWEMDPEEGEQIQLQGVSSYTKRACIL